MLMWGIVPAPVVAYGNCPGLGVGELAQLGEDGDRAERGQQQGVPVRLGSRHLGGADGPGGPRDVLDDHLGIQGLGKLGLDDAAGQVARAAGGVGDDDGEICSGGSGGQQAEEHCERKEPGNGFHHGVHSLS
jgi:hypothetical protein